MSVSRYVVQHLSCDGPGHNYQRVSVEYPATAEELDQQIKRVGWELQADGQVFCPVHKPTESGTPYASRTTPWWAESTESGER